MPRNDGGRRGGRFVTGLLRFFLMFVVPLAILFIGGKAAYQLVETGPKAERNSSGARNARLVEVLTARRTSEPTIIHAMGTVTPAMKIQFRPRVSGEVVEVSKELMPGGLFREKEMILRLDPTDYELIVRQREGEKANADSDYRLELGSQAVARREYELLGETIREEDRDLVLREPQLKTVEAALDVAEAALERARLDLARTTVRAPFNAVVESRDVNLGAQVSNTTPLAVLVGTDEYWIEVSLPVDQLKWIRIPRKSGGKGSVARVVDEAAWGPGVHRIGQVVRLAGNLEEEGRMARLLVSVPDPLGLEAENAGAPVLLIDSYVRVEIEGLHLDDVVPVDRRMLREGEYVWILDNDGMLDIRKVEILFRGRDRVLVRDGIEEGERIVSTDLAAPVDGMPLRTKDEAAPGGAGGGAQ